MEKKTKILAPNLPESVNHAIMLKWNKKIGDYVKEDEIIAEIETDKIILEISSPKNGILISQNILVGEKIKSQSVIGFINNKNIKKEKKIKNNKKTKKKNVHSENSLFLFTPKMRRLILNYNIDISKIKGIDVHGKININNFIIKNKKNSKKKKKDKLINIHKKNNKRIFRKIAMSPLRKTISKRLLYTVKNTAMLTTFNEVNMQPIISIRNKYKDIFENKYKSKLGFMSFYVKSVTQALKKFPEINASIEKKNIIYHDYYDINIAISTPRGLITPILKNTDNLSIYEIEKKIKSFVLLGEQGKLKFEDLEAGTFTITNGGVFGSLMSTPIINPPQVAILGMHHIKKRPIVVNKKIKILPMMYLALSYDHQLIDGKQAIQFLNYIKDILEDISRFILEI
ncbi:dihydrolipoyllysine-residue succinyltransferase [Buchnera aphidicola]|uniref:Dihydrolipoyllysine-residue succinyltransferase n=1 Tax=Buchnera aphidicola subsp. Cinara cedri (strain Cc) TaxID=372461 RepID=Q057P2_BUCCC|nr:dihydrolipoyllysine-residue succinyltransferase [Buchnera aphidicola]ABJ90657.1 2-oxoglutarate dehydrogenase E2 component [Buchnera aphidicola BCc]